MTGALTYDEPASLSPSANAVVVLVAGTGKPNTDTIVASQVVSPVGQQPIPFNVPYPMSEIDPDLTYTIQAQLEDGSHVWQTSGGVHVITHGHASSDVTVPLVYEPDLMKGEVTGQITGVGVRLQPGSYSAAAIVRVDTGQIVGIDTSVNPGSTPIPFLLAFDPANIDQNADYVVEAKVVSGDITYQTVVGVPVITKGNPLSGVTVTVARATSAETTAATTEDTNRTLWPIILAIGLAIFGVNWFRSRKGGRHAAGFQGNEDSSATTGEPIQPTEVPPDDPLGGSPTSP